MQLSLATKSQSALALSLTILYLPVPPEYLGGFASVPVVDRGVVAAANFAASANSATLTEIIAARQQLMAGKTYDLCLRVKNKATATPYLVKTKIFKPFGKAYQLKSWTRVNTCTFDE